MDESFTLPKEIPQDTKKVDRRKEASKANALKAREAKLAKLAKKLEDDKKAYQSIIPKEEDEEETIDIVYVTEKAKPTKVIEKKEVVKKEPVIDTEKEELKKKLEELSKSMDILKQTTEANKKVDVRNELLKQYASSLLKF